MATFVVLAFTSATVCRADSGGIPAGSASCPHVRVLTAHEASEVEDQFRPAIVSPGPNQMLALQSALDLLPPLACQAIRRVVFLNAVLPEAPEAIAWVGKSRPDLINISAVPGTASEERLTLDLSDLPNMDAEHNRQRKAAMVKVWPEVIHSVFHEAFHCATYLLEAAKGDSGTANGPWPPAAVAEARTALTRTETTGGFVQEWIRLNREFYETGLEEAYDSSRTGRKAAPPEGFMTYYGGHSPGEDIAETASWPAAMPLFDAAYGGVKPDLSDWKYACPKLAEYQGKGIPGEFAALYTKLQFLVDVGLMTEEAMSNCIGSGTMGLERNPGEVGFQFFEYQTWKPLTAYRVDVQSRRTADHLWLSGWGTLHHKGKSYKTLIELQFAVDEGSLPRGVYTITKCNDFAPASKLYASPVLFRRRIPDNPSQSICAYDAIALVSRATTKVIEGSVFVRKVWKFSKPPVPEVSGFPVHVVFGFEK